MFNRAKFDAVVGKVLTDAGYATNAEKFSVWPAGLSASLIKQGKQIGLDAKTNAYIGLAKYFSDASELSSHIRLRVVNAALMCALRDGDIGTSVIAKLQDILQGLKGPSEERQPDF